MRLQEDKQLKKQVFRKQQEEHHHTYQYLKANTNLFAKKEKPKEDPVKEKYVFSPKPIPWFVAETNMLTQINHEKNMRKKALTAQAKKKMHNYWKDLPNAIRDTYDISDNLIPGYDQISVDKTKPIKVK